MTAAHPELTPVPVNEARYPSLSGRSVLITGGGSGIGAHLVAAYCAQGARVAFIERDADSAAASAQAAGQAAGQDGTPPEVAICDLTDIAATRQAIADLAARCGPFRVLVNNAGNDDRLPVEKVEPDYWDERFAVNLRHQFFCAQAVLPGMIAAGGGSIVAMGSTSWMQGAAGLIAYTTAKSAVAGLTKSLAREVGHHGVRVNCIAPGWILTERQVTRAKAIYPDKFASYLDRQCLKSFLLPPDVARMALWLSADDSRMVTGQTFIVDGGVV
jgi:NAD(P)-dependent dehydrogenase (short-subunit alcohol dehydrogenase family)